MRGLFAGLIMASGLAACSTTDGGSDYVGIEGTVAYRERIALAPNARISVELRDVSRADAPSTLIASESFTADGRQVPIPFKLEYDPSKIDPRFTYAVSARITDASGQLMFITDTRYQIPSPGQSIALNLVRTGG